jgi:pimeloyl-ACP methyl ester carboxylesterase
LSRDTDTTSKTTKDSKAEAEADANAHAHVRADAKIEHLPGIVCKLHYFDVPLDYSELGERTIKVFAREVVSVENSSKASLPYLLFLQGGPGFPSPRPEGAEGWLKRALRDYRVLLLDQRGTGLSTAVTEQALSTFADAKAQFEYIKHFRADNIVRDCEFIRKALIGNEKWTVLGQSFGGFCATTYLSLAPEGLAGVAITGGLPPVSVAIDDVYRATYRQLIKKNNLFNKRFPNDVEMVRRIVQYLRTNKVVLPTGEALSADRFLQLGLSFGFNVSGNSINTIHYLLENAFVEQSGNECLSSGFLSAVERRAEFNNHPIYALLHESLYCEGQASNWSAEKVRSEFPEFAKQSEPYFFTSEMICRWMFDEYSNLKPLKELAEIIAAYDSWPKLYDVERLRKNKVPVAACVYYNDIYVDRAISEQTADIICGAKVWITNEYEHDGLRQDGVKILDRLFEMLKDVSA